MSMNSLWTNSIKCDCCPHIKTSQLISRANQLTGFYMRATLAFNGLNSTFPFNYLIRFIKLFVFKTYSQWLEPYSEPWQICKIDLFAKILNQFHKNTPTQIFKWVWIRQCYMFYKPYLLQKPRQTSFATESTSHKFTV